MDRLHTAASQIAAGIVNDDVRSGWSEFVNALLSHIHLLDQQVIELRRSVQSLRDDEGVAIGSQIADRMIGMELRMDAAGIERKAIRASQARASQEREQILSRLSMAESQTAKALALLFRIATALEIDFDDATEHSA